MKSLLEKLGSRISVTTKMVPTKRYASDLYSYMMIEYSIYIDGEAFDSVRIFPMHGKETVIEVPFLKSTGVIFEFNVEDYDEVTDFIGKIKKNSLNKDDLKRCLNDRFGNPETVEAKFEELKASVHEAIYELRTRIFGCNVLDHLSRHTDYYKGQLHGFELASLYLSTGFEDNSIKEQLKRWYKHAEELDVLEERRGYISAIDTFKLMVASEGGAV